MKEMDMDETNLLELVVIEGPLKGQKFQVKEDGLRLGRSSSCGIAITDDMALSRNHCLFELVDGDILLTDLVSANGTILNGEMLDAESKKLKIGDIIEVGDTKITVANASSDVDASSMFDLGLSGDSETNPEDDARVSSSPLLRIVIWLIAFLVVGGAAWFILGSDSLAAPSNQQDQVADQLAQSAKLHSLYYEKVEASSKGIYRYSISMKEDGEILVEVDDVPKENRHVRKNTKLSDAARDTISRMLVPGFKDQSVEDGRLLADLYRLEREYVGTPLASGSYDSVRLRVVASAKVFSVTCENTQMPEALGEICKKLETFSKNELGMWAIQYSTEKLIELSSESRRAGDAKWDERDVQYGNLAAALSAYQEAIFYLDTVNPKPANYGELVKRRDETAAELDRRYRDQRFMADRAINLKDWETAKRELRILCDMVPDKKDPRHAEASSKLMDVESRIKNGGSK
jgi:pSer/pThr/pTyr-binding forkhead associated (FHA) protein